MVAVGGASGSVARFIISELINERTDGSFPWGTLTVNVIGCLIIGLLMGLTDTEILEIHENRLLFITGLCGGFTTFSAFAYENVHMILNGNSLTAIVYTLACVMAGIFATMFGLFLTRP